MKLVLIEWLDSFGCSSDWQELDEARLPKAMICRSVGWLFRDERDCKVIVPHVADVTDESKQGCGDMTILTAAITRMVDLHEKPLDTDGPIR